jgi:hypothetical protein
MSTLPLAVAEALAYVGTERPLLPGKTHEESALIMISAHLRKELFPQRFSDLEHLSQLHETTAQVIQQKRLTGSKPSDYDTLINKFDKNNYNLFITQSAHDSGI